MMNNDGKEYALNIFLDGEVVGKGKIIIPKIYNRLYYLAKHAKSKRIRKKNVTRINMLFNERIKQGFKEWGKNEKKRVSEKMPPM